MTRDPAAGKDELTRDLAIAKAVAEAAAKVCATMSHGMDMPARRLACDDCIDAIRALDLTAILSALPPANPDGTIKEPS